MVICNHSNPAPADALAIVDAHIMKSCPACHHWQLKVSAWLHVDMVVSPTLWCCIEMTGALTVGFVGNMDNISTSYLQLDTHISLWRPWNPCRRDIDTVFRDQPQKSMFCALLSMTAGRLQRKRKVSGCHERCHSPDGNSNVTLGSGPCNTSLFYPRHSTTTGRLWPHEEPADLVRNTTAFRTKITTLRL